MLSIKGFSKSYADTLILSITELSFDAGIYWIKGQNGSGKSTFFRSLAGVIPCTGKIEFNDGIALNQQPITYRKLVNYSEAEPLYPGFLTARDLVHFIGKAKGASLQQQQHYINAFGIDSYFEKPCETYSSGMLKKLSLALAFLGTPRVIILDEPLITLDQHSRNILFQLITSLMEKQSVTFLISSHQLIEWNELLINATYSIQDKTLVKI
jgi:ABC-2 type transport system ATP-binding protein